MSSWKHVREKTIYSADNFNSEISLANSSIKYNSSVLNDEEIDDTLVVWGRLLFIKLCGLMEQLA